MRDIFLTGELKPKQNVLVKVSNGKFYFNGEEMVSNETLQHFDTPLKNNSNVIATNHTDLLTVNVPKGVRVTGVRQYGDNYIQNV